MYEVSRFFSTVQPKIALFLVRFIYLNLHQIEANKVLKAAFIDSEERQTLIFVEV